MFSALLWFAIRATILLGAAWTATTLARRASAATRHLVWTGATAGVLALPLMSLVIPQWNVPVLAPEVVSTPSVIEPSRPSASIADAVSTQSPISTALPAAATSPPVESGATSSGIVTRVVTFARTVSLTAAMAWSWLVVSVILLLRLAIANARVVSWRRASRLVEDFAWLALLRRLSNRYAIERPVVLLDNASTDVPVTWGIVYPVIMLPESARQWDEEQRVAVLTHELAHIKRFDALTQLIAQMAVSLLWFHPLVWLAVRKMRLEREHACDDFVLVGGARPSRYADDLLGLARRLHQPTAPAAAALAMARRSELEGRLLAILDPAVKRTSVQRARVALLTGGVMILAAPLAAFTPGPRQATVIPSQSAVAPAPVPAATPRIIQTERTTVTTTAARIVSVDSDTHVLESLTRKLGVMMPSTLFSTLEERALRQVRVDTEPPATPVDLQTLIDVTKAAKRMTSDMEKGELLALIARRYQRSDALREAYLDAVSSMSSDMERSKALVALLERDDMPAASIAQVLRSAAMMSSDMERGSVLKKISPAVFADTAVQRAYLDVLLTMSSDMERGQALGVLVKQRPLSQPVKLALLQAMTGISGNIEKANALLLFLDKQGVGEEPVRRAFLKAAETLTSDGEYRRVIAAVMK